STWDLTELAASYRAFTEDVQQLRHQVRGSCPPPEAYRTRAQLVHRWRKFLFVDPGLPPDVLPADWPGQPARDLFLEVADHLLPPARIFVTEALAAAGATDPSSVTAEDPTQ